MPRFHKLKPRIREVAPDEIFLDSSNLPNFDQNQMEGRLERPMSRTTYLFITVLFLLPALLLLVSTARLQIVRGAYFRQRSERNTLEQSPIFATRGIIYDRLGVELASNAPERLYQYVPGLAPILGYIGKPNEEEVKNGAAFSEELIGRAGAERAMNATLRGKSGIQVQERDAHGIIQSENVQIPPKDGEAITLSIDSELEAVVYRAMEKLAQERGFQGGAAVIMDVHSGELLSAASFPSYDPNVFVTKNKAETLRAYDRDSRKPFLDRVIAGQYTPGSIVKPIMAIGALNEQIISPEKQILSTGSLRVPNPFQPGKDSVFRDWKAHGWVDMRRALAVSSDVYFYEVGGGFGDQEGLGIDRIEKYARLFGLGEPTGVEISGERLGTIPSPQWKKENFNGEDWRLGDTYHTAIGQYGFQVTPLQMVRAIGAIATEGKLITPTIVERPQASSRVTTLPIPAAYFKIVKEGMRLGTEEGTSMGLSNPTVKIAGKTGTAELGVGKEKVNSWIVGFLPYENPKIAFVMVMEKGPRSNLVGATFAMRQIIDWMIKNRPEYLGLAMKE